MSDGRPTIDSEPLQKALEEISEAHVQARVKAIFDGDDPILARENLNQLEEDLSAAFLLLYKSYPENWREFFGVR